MNNTVLFALAISSTIAIGLIGGGYLIKQTEFVQGVCIIALGSIMVVVGLILSGLGGSLTSKAMYENITITGFEITDVTDPNNPVPVDLIPNKDFIESWYQEVKKNKGE